MIFTRGTTSAGRLQRGAAAAVVGVVLGVATIGCGASDGEASGGAGSGGTAEAAPACATERPLLPRMTLSGAAVVYDEPHFVRVLERGSGLPPGTTEESTAVSRADSGWLRLAIVDAGEGADAGAARAGDVANDVASSESSPEQILAGPREVGELPVTVGDILQLTYTTEMRFPFQYHTRTLLWREDTVLLFHQDTAFREHKFGTFSDFTLALGDAVCAEPFPDVERRCADVSWHALEVTVPGGATATLAPGQTAEAGRYRMRHGTTESVSRLRVTPANSSCADLGDGYGHFMAALRAEDEGLRQGQ